MCKGQYPEAEISAYANWACDAYENRVLGQPTKLQPLYQRPQLVQKDRSAIWENLSRDDTE
jgi:hypothetical protein